MRHLVGIDKGPVMDWRNDMGPGERYRKWKKCVDVLFKRPLYWNGDHGMVLVDKWTTKGKINDGNKDQQNTYWTHFEEYIHPQTNQLLAIVELKRLFQGNFEFRRLSHQSTEISSTSWI